MSAAPTPPKRRLLFVIDSIADDYGCTGIASRAQQHAAGWHVDVLRFPGRRLADVRKELNGLNLGPFDAAIMHLGNAEVHPRMPRTPLRWLRRKGLTLARDGLFAIQPWPSWQWLFRIPLLCIRRVTIHLWPRAYSTPDGTLEHLVAIHDQVRQWSQHVVVVPIFPVRPALYGKAHNQAASHVNARLASEGLQVANMPWCRPESARSHFNWDGFHLKDSFHERAFDSLATALRRAPDGATLARLLQGHDA